MIAPLLYSEESAITNPPARSLRGTTAARDPGKHLPRGSTALDVGAPNSRVDAFSSGAIGERGHSRAGRTEQLGHSKVRPCVWQVGEEGSRQRRQGHSRKMCGKVISVPCMENFLMGKSQVRYGRMRPPCLLQVNVWKKKRIFRLTRLQKIFVIKIEQMNIHICSECNIF